MDAILAVNYEQKNSAIDYVGLTRPMISALGCNANVVCSGELNKGALCRPNTCSDPVGIVDWRGVLFMSLRI